MQRPLPLEGAFVLHRSGEGCIEPMDDGRFVALADDAKCQLARVAYTPLEAGNRQVYPGGWEPSDAPAQRVVEPVTLWTLAAGLEGARMRLSAGGGKATDGLDRADPTLHCPPGEVGVMGRARAKGDRNVPPSCR